MTHKFCYRPSKSSATEARYIGSRTGAGTSVVIQTPKGREPLRPRLDLIRHSPVGFDWAHTGSRAAQLALALLAHASGSDDLALEHHQVFKHEIIARLPKSGWDLTSEQVLQMLRFVAQGAELPMSELQPKPARVRKTAIIQAQLPTGTSCAEIKANGSACNIGDAATRAIRNLLRDARLRRRPIVNLEMELSIINCGDPMGEGDQRGHDSVPIICPP